MIQLHERLFAMQLSVCVKVVEKIFSKYYVIYKSDIERTNSSHEKCGALKISRYKYSQASSRRRTTPHRFDSSPGC
jgi:hypothetical protein